MNQFLQEKANNFRVYVKEHAKLPVDLDQYKDDQLIPFVLTHLIPLYATGMLSTAVDKVAETVGNQDPEFKAKVVRYLQCFCECVSL